MYYLLYNFICGLSKIILILLNWLLGLNWVYLILLLGLNWIKFIL